MRKILLILLFSAAIAVQAQPTFVQDTAIAVTENGHRLKCPWVGGFNCPQFSAIDLNGDGIKDLFVFDRSTNAVKTFINKGTPNTVDYVYAPQYEAAFPPMQSYALLADYNCDGKEDIYTATDGGIMVYKNVSTPGNLQFVLATDLIHSTYYNQYYLNLFVNAVNIPSIVDIDNDGDLDILTIEVGGSYVEYHKNMSMETYGNCDSLVFVYQSGCWGDFTASASSNDVYLGQCSAREGHFDARVDHSGSTMLAVDLRGTGVKDLLLGDIIANNLLLLTNGGTLSSANMISKQDSFPENDVHVNMFSFPAPFLLDVDNDGIKDLIVAPDLPGSSENTHSAWFYKNMGTNSTPSFVLQTKSFLQEDMIDVGEGAAPAFFDYDGDGLQDLLIGNYGYFQQGTYLSGITAFRNTGTLTQPAFDLTTTDYAGISTMGINSIVPTFGDVDGDGDLDMVVGESLGRLFYFNNTAEPGKPAVFVTPTQPWLNINVGTFSAPQLVDVNKDGLLDLLIGTRNGNIAYYQNTGTTTTPSYTLITNTWGNVDTRPEGYITGYCSPMLLHCNKQNLLLCGTENGSLYLYSDVDTGLNKAFNLADTAFDNIIMGSRSMIATADINNDSKPDMVVGGYGGGVAIYIQTGNCVDSVTTRVTRGIATNDDAENELNVYPNPASQTLTIQASSIIAGAQIADIVGRVVYTNNEHSENKTINLETLNWPNGLYICYVRLSNGAVKTTKISIVH